MNPRMNLSPNTDAAVPTVRTKMIVTGRDKPSGIVIAPARTTPKMNLKRIVTRFMITLTNENQLGGKSFMFHIY